MGDADFREFARADMQAGLAAIALHVVTYSASIGLLLPVQRLLAARTRMRTLAWFGFGLLALVAYVVTAIPSWVAHDHLLFWRTGRSSLCHLVGLFGKTAPLLGGAIVILFRRVRSLALLRVVALLLALAAFGVAGIASYRWFTFPTPDYKGGFITFHPAPESLGFVLMATGIVAAASAAIARRILRPLAG